jgi:hypothetical protein
LLSYHADFFMGNGGSDPLAKRTNGVSHT